MSHLVFLVICVHFVFFTTLASQSHDSKSRLKRSSNNSEEFGGLSLHSYMKQLYSTRAQGNGNGSFTISLRTQKIVATSIRGFEPERSGTKWQGSTIQMQFRLGNAFKDDTLVEAELVVTSKQGSLWMSRKFIVNVYFHQPILAPNDTKLLDSRSFPRMANVEFGLNVTRAVKVWSLTAAKTYTIQLRIEDLAQRNSTKASLLRVWRFIKHGHLHGPFLVLYTHSKHANTKDDIWKLVTLNPNALSPIPDNTTVGKENKDITQSDGRAARHPSLTCYQVSFAIKMKDYYSNIIMPQIGYINYCDGYCYFPIQNHLTPTTHAIIWALWWRRHSSDTYTPKRPLCIPSKLGTITVILSDPETGQPVQKEWQEFSAEECGCR